MINSKWNILTIGCLITSFCISGTVYGSELVPISGDISSVSFDSMHTSYFAASDIIIPAGSSMKIPAGTVFLFKNGASFSIQGQCTIDGTDSAPVVFTSINDSIYNQTPVSPSPFDWAGIRIAESAGEVRFREVIIRYAKHPFESQCPSLKLENVRRSQTVENNFLIKREKVFVPTDSDFVYSTHKTWSLTRLLSGSSSKPKLQDTPQEGLKQAPSWRWSLLGTGVGVVLVSGGCYLGYYGKMKQSSEKYDEYLYNENLDAYNKATKYKRRGRYFKYASITGGITGILLLTGYGVTFNF